MFYGIQLWWKKTNKKPPKNKTKNKKSYCSSFSQTSRCSCTKLWRSPWWYQNHIKLLAYWKRFGHNLAREQHSIIRSREEIKHPQTQSSIKHINTFSYYSQFPLRQHKKKKKKKKDTCAHWDLLWIRTIHCNIRPKSRDAEFDLIQAVHYSPESIIAITLLRNHKEGSLWIRACTRVCIYIYVRVRTRMCICMCVCTSSFVKERAQDPTDSPGGSGSCRWGIRVGAVVRG